MTPRVRCILTLAAALGLWLLAACTNVYIMPACAAGESMSPNTGACAAEGTDDWYGADAPEPVTPTVTPTVTPEA